jgi:hypothetical protein
MPDFGLYKRMPGYLGQKLNQVKNDADVRGFAGKAIEGFLTSKPKDALRNMGREALALGKKKGREFLEKEGEKLLSQGLGAIGKMASRR